MIFQICVFTSWPSTLRMSFVQDFFPLFNISLDLWIISKCLFIYIWLCWVFTTALRLSLVAASRGFSPLWSTGSRVHGLQQLHTQIEVFHSDTWDLPGPQVKPTSLVLADGFLTTGPPGKSSLNKF